jgi:F-type H+-transporting ATPase subunit b
MLIDWFTVGAQAANFVVLVWLLKRFLYAPILNAVDAREKRIAKERADADTIKTEAGKDRDAFRQKNAAFDAERAALMAKATAEAAAERQRLLDEARATADALAAKRQAALDSEASALKDTIADQAGREVYAIARKALGDLADSDLEDRLCDAFIRRLGNLAGAPKATLAAALAGAAGSALVRSAFDLPKARQVAIRKAVKEAFPASPALHFETAPDLIGGIELTANGQKLAWSIAGYLAAMEQRLASVMQAAKPAEPVAAAPKRAA